MSHCEDAEHSEADEAIWWDMAEAGSWAGIRLSDQIA
jgi:hypothetical protein